MPNYNKKAFADIYVIINKWNLIPKSINIFRDITICHSNDLNECGAMKRIQIILHKLHQSSRSFAQIINDLFIANKYTNTMLLNDFHHMMYTHDIDENEKHNKFHEIYTKLTNNMNIICDVEKCKHIQRHWRDRTKSDIHANDLNNQSTINLVSTIHVYFIHLYDINRLKPDEMNIIREELELLKQCGLDEEDEKKIEILETKKYEMMTTIINCRRQKLEKSTVQRNNHKYISGVIAQNEEAKDQVVDFYSLQHILTTEGLSIEIATLRNMFSTDQNDKDSFMTNIIDKYCHIDENVDENDQHGVLSEYILYKYLKKYDLKTEHLIQIAQKIIDHKYPNIDVEEFATIARKIEPSINGKMFIKGTHEFMNSTKFAKLFKSITNYNKKAFSYIYVTINKWTPITETKNKFEGSDEKYNVEHDAKEEDDSKEQHTQMQIYSIG
eukprot:486731_1